MASPLRCLCIYIYIYIYIMKATCAKNVTNYKKYKKYFI